MHDGEDPLLAQQQRPSAVNARYRKFLWRVKLWMGGSIIAVILSFKLHDFLMRNLPRQAVRWTYAATAVLVLVVLGRRTLRGFLRRLVSWPENFVNPPAPNPDGKSESN